MFYKNRRRIFLGALMLIIAVPILQRQTRSAEAADIMVYKPAQCTCCGKWTEHLKKNGFHVTTKIVSDAEMDKIKTEHGVTPELASCHTAIVDGYVVEGHVPADEIKRMLEERPRIVGLAAPGMPKSAPGMDEPGEPYDILSFDVNGKTNIYSRH